MIKPDKNDFNEKIERVQSYIDLNGYTGMILGRRDNFSWITGGGRNNIMNKNEMGCCLLVITASKIYTVSRSMDTLWVMDQVPNNLNVESIEHKWFEDTLCTSAVKLAGDNIVCDIQIKNTEQLMNDIFKLHYPMTERDYRMYRQGVNYMK